MNPAAQTPESSDHGPSGPCPVDSGWEPCAPGVLGGLRRDLRSRRARLVAARVAGGLTAALFVVAVGLAAVPGWSASGGTVAAISCDRCIELMPSYHDQVIGVEEAVAISPEDVASVARHLEGCWFCRKKFEERYPGVLAASASAAAGLALFGTRRLALPRQGRA